MAVLARDEDYVLRWLDERGDSQVRAALDRYRREHGLPVADRCRACNTTGGHYTCPESDRVAFSCTNYRGKG